MKISAHVNITNPERWGYPYLESIKSFANFCDEVIVVDGGSTDGSLEKLKLIPKVKIIQGEEWKENFNWLTMGRNLQRGLEECKNDWCFKFDIDYIFHEKYISKLKSVFNASGVFKSKDYLAIAFTKINFVTVNRGFVKKSYPLLINKNKEKSLCYEIGYFADEPDREGATFLYPVIKNILSTGEYLVPSYSEVYNAPIEIYSYDFTFMTKEQVGKNRCRFEKALSDYRKGNKVFTIERSLRGTEVLLQNRYNKCKRAYKLNDHSEFIQEKIKNIQSNQLGYNIWGYVN